jgi:phosphoribosylanthranilate isomerase
MIPVNALKDGGIPMREPAREKIFAALIDTEVNGASGGTGLAFDWEATREAVQSFGLHVPVIVAGGLTALNVGRAIKTLQPFGVDVASGVEARPGKKDGEKVRAFVRAVREADRRTS